MPVRSAKIRVLDNTLQDRHSQSLRKAGIGDYLLLLSAAGMWGGTFLLNEIALDDFSPVAIAAYRISLAAIILSLICVWKGLLPKFDGRTFGLLTLISLLNSVVPFSLIGWGQLRIDSATTGILLASSPFFSLLLSHYMTHDDRFSWNKFVGLVFGFFGVVCLLWQGLLIGGGSLMAMFAVVIAAACYSLSAVLIRRLGPMPSLLLVASSLAIASLVLLPILIWWYPPWQQEYSGVTLSAVLFLAIGPTATAYVLRVKIVQNTGAVFMSNVGYLIPLFAVFWGWLFLSQTPTIVMWVSLILIFIGIGLGQRK